VRQQQPPGGRFQEERWSYERTDFGLADRRERAEFKEAGLLDTAVVVVNFDSGAIATTEANFSAVYGYDVRAEVFGSGGMVSSGDTALTGVTLIEPKQNEYDLSVRGLVVLCS